MEQQEILQIIMEQLNSIYELDDETLRNIYEELSEASDEKLTSILTNLSDFRKKQLQDVQAFIRIDDQEKRAQEEQKEREAIDIDLDL